MGKGLLTKSEVGSQKYYGSRLVIDDNSLEVRSQTLWKQKMVLNTTAEVKAIARYIRMSPRKVRRVLDQIRGRSYQEALIILEFMPYRACEPILKVLRSAAANAEHNNGLDRASLFVSKAYADGGPCLKRYRARAQGRAYQIRKPTSHITIAVAPSLDD
jgi:large subunit ribosomal protein L22